MTCIIVEDEIPSQNILKNFLGKIPDLQLLGVFKAAIEANSFLSSNQVDLVFLDINLPDMPGIDFIKTIKNPPAVIITTAYPDYAVSSFELDTIIDYLVKPFSFNRFLKAVNKAKERTVTLNNPLEETRESIYINVDKTLHKIILDEIVFIESNRNYITVATTKQRLSYIDSLKNWAAKLQESQFVQIHKSYIINKTLVDKISGNEIYVQGNKLPIGRTYKQELLKKLHIV